MSGRRKLGSWRQANLLAGMTHGGFLSEAERQELRALARNGLSEARVARRANAIVLLDDGWSCSAQQSSSLTLGVLGPRRLVHLLCCRLFS
jgi:hypothetical protein